MVRITIDGQLAQVPAGTTIMEAAKAVNVKNPSSLLPEGNQ